MNSVTPLRRNLSLPMVTFYGIGTILGAGIYVLVGKVAGVAGFHTPLAFLVAAFIAAFSAFSYAELSARMPKSAGEAVYVQAGFGIPRLSLLVGLLIVLIGIVSTATLMHGFAGYFKVFINLPDGLVIVVITLLMGLIVSWGIRQSVLIAVIMTLFEIGGLVLIIWVAGDSYGQIPRHLPELLPPLEPALWYGIFLGGFIAFYAFIGFEDIVNVAEEVIEPERNLPIAITLVLIITTLFYILVTLASVMIIAPDQLAQTDAPLAMVYQHATGNKPFVITVISLISVLNGALIQIIMASRVLYGLSRQQWLPSFLGYVHPRTRTPLAATAIITLLILLFALLLPLLSLARLTSFFTLTIFILMNLSLWRIKRRDDREYHGFRIPVWIPVAGVTVSVLFLLLQMYDLVLT
jgi:amino acid transporter